MNVDFKRNHIIFLIFFAFLIISFSTVNLFAEDQSPSKSSFESVTTLTNLRFWSAPTYNRIVFDTDGKASYSHKLIEKEASNSQLDQIVIDFQNCVIGKKLKDVTLINSNLINAVQAKQISSDSVRIIIKVNSVDDYKVFSIDDPFRVVIDILGVNAGKTNLSNNDKMFAGLGLGVNRICIDPGFGGKELGGVGYIEGIFSKDVNLVIAEKLAHKIDTKLNSETILTRDNDEFISLEERTNIANTNKADLFISIHCNSHNNPEVYGIETYYLSINTDEEAVKVAASKNATSEKNIQDLQSILGDLRLNTRIDMSRRLAECVQSSLIQYLGTRYTHIKNNGIKNAPFYVLIDAEMPSILIEVSYISNPRECERLMSDKYQDDLAEAIVIGVENYRKSE